MAYCVRGLTGGTGLQGEYVEGGGAGDPRIPQYGDASGDVNDLGDEEDPPGLPLL